MPNFTARFSAGSHQTLWTDTDTPTRLNSATGHPTYYTEVYLGGTVTLKATVDAVEGPMDAALGGDLFAASFAQLPSWPAPACIGAAAQSSVVTFTPTAFGVHLVTLRRANGGAISLHFYVVDLS